MNCEELVTLCTIISRKTTMKVILKGITIIKVIEKDSICLYKNIYMNVQSISIHYSKNNKQSKSPSTGEWIFFNCDIFIHNKKEQKNNTQK